MVRHRRQARGPTGQQELTLNVLVGNSYIEGIFYLPSQTRYASDVIPQGHNYFGIVADSLSQSHNSTVPPAVSYSTLANGNPLYEKAVFQTD